MANLKVKGQGDERVGSATPTERPLKMKESESEEEYAERMASYGLPHLRLIGDDLAAQQIFVSDFISEILGNFDDLEEELAELKEKVI